MQRTYHLAGLMTGFAVCLFAMILLNSSLDRATGQDSDRDAFRKLHNELREQMNADLKGATAFLEAKIKADPDSSDLNVLRHSLASKLLSERKFKEAHAQFNKLLGYQIDHLNNPENVFGVLMTINSIKEAVEESGEDDELEEAVEKGFKALSDLPSGTQPLVLSPRSQLAVMKAHTMIDNDQSDAANELIQSQLAALTTACEGDDAKESTMHSLVRFLKALTTTDRQNDSWRDEYVKKLTDVVGQAIEKYPESVRLQNDYASVQFLMITRWGQDDPEANKKRIEEVSDKLHLIAVKNRSIRATLRRIDLYKERIAAAKPVSTLVGKPAPEWDIDAWVNGEGLTRDSFKGKVVLIDFWAMWCGPCVATFPHLREWREEFADDGFEIVGVTKYYNFEWDDENKRASRSKEKVSKWNERATLASFLEHHKLEHPVIVTPEESDMSGEYGVKGIPHIALMDRDGVIQLIKTGAGAATAKEIHEKIKKLVETKASE